MGQSTHSSYDSAKIYQVTRETPTKTVAIVDDSELILDILQTALIRIGYQVLRFHSGADLVKDFGSADCHLILIDVNMPDLDGPQTIELLKNDPAAQAIPVVLMGGSEDYTPDQFPTLGIVDTLPKPFNLTDLQRILHYAC